MNMSDARYGIPSKPNGPTYDLPPRPDNGQQLQWHVKVPEGFDHYYKPCGFDRVDVYRVLRMFGVTDPAIAHAVKKLLVAGGRGAKDQTKDVQEAVVSLTRFLAMEREDNQK